MYEQLIISVIYLLVLKAEENPRNAPEMASATQVASSKCFLISTEYTRAGSRIGLFILVGMLTHNDNLKFK